MKICVISRPRTLSSYLTYSLAEYYNLKNRFEYYNTTFSSIEQKKTRILYKKENLNILKIAEESIKSATKDVFIDDKFICKIFPRHFIITQNVTDVTLKTSYPFSINSPNDFMIVPNRIDLFELDNYDKLFLLDRSVYASAISYVYALKNLRFMVKKEYENQINAPKPVVIEKNFFADINMAILEYCVYEKFKKEIIGKYNYTLLNDKTVKQFIDTNLKSSQTTIAHKNNYEQTILNYTEIVSYIDEQLPLYEKAVEQKWCPGEDSNLHAQGSGF